jgi:molybdopterin-synthase adenylyltransferase
MSNRESVDPVLTRARVLIVGVGGLGSPAAMTLAAAGVGSLGLVDPDRVEVSNLHRQPLYEEDDVGRPKVEAAAERLRRAHPSLRVETHTERFGSAHVALARTFDLVLDGTDTVTAKFVVNDAAVAAGVPLVHAGALGFRAQLLTVLPGASACYRCVFEEPPPPEDTPSCETAGVLGPAVALAGTLVAAEALRILTARHAAFADRLLVMDLRAGTWRTVPVTRNPACTVCGTAGAGRAVRRSAAR